MKRGFWPVLVVLLVVLVAGGGPALAKKSGSSFSSGGRSSRSSGWGNTSSAPKSSGWGNSSRSTTQSTAPSATPLERGTARPSGRGWGNTSGATAPSSGPTATRRTSAFATSGQTAIQKESSRKAYNEYQGRFAKPENPVNPSSAQTTPIPTPSRTWDNYRDYRGYRDTYYAGRGWTPPGYAYRSYPSFGLWDAMFLWFMLRQASGPSFMYNHQDDPGVKAFRQEADKLSASNDDLKKQLTDLDAKVDQMRRDGVQVDPKAMPEGIDPAVALAADKVVQEKPDAGNGGIGTWIAIVGAGFGVAALYLLVPRRRKNV
jgi:hypothetical protein